MQNKIKSYIKIIDKTWTDGSTNEQIWIGEEITKKGKYYFVDRTHQQGREIGCILRYRISWVVDPMGATGWFIEWKYLELDESSNRDHWREWFNQHLVFETDLKPIIPRKQKKKVYGNAVITWAERGYSGKIIKNTRLVQFHYKKDGCYYFKTPPLDIDGWENKQWRINADHEVEIKNCEARWQEVYNRDYGLTFRTTWAKVVSAEIY